MNLQNMNFLQNPQQQGIVQAPQQRTVFLQTSTKNQSFINMHNYLKNKGIKNNAFMLILYDAGLANINPHDPNLPPIWQQRVWRECMINFWYFIREVVRIPDQGGSATGVPYMLHRGNLALNFCMLLNINVFHEIARQNGKTMSTAIWYLYLFNFGTSYSSMFFLNQNKEKSEENLQTLKNVRAMLPSYLRFDRPIGVSGRLIKPKDSTRLLSNVNNGNVIKTVPSARNKIIAGNLIRGKTVPLLWFDEYAFIPFNETIFINGAPAFKTASENARNNGKAYGIVITTTPGDLTTGEGKSAFLMKETATNFNENWYDLNYQQIMTIIGANKSNNFVYIKFTYQQLGRSEKWFEEICTLMQHKWADIRREVLLEWNSDSTNSPFTKEQLAVVNRKTRDPIKIVMLMNRFAFEIYEYPEYIGNMPKYPPIIGVDVGGGVGRDASAITCIDSRTTRVFATFNSRNITLDELPDLIWELVSKFMPNAIVNIERTGGFGLSVVSKLIRRYPKFKEHNMYWEFKDRIIEESVGGSHLAKRKVRKKVYGLDNNKETRRLLVDLMMQRMDGHKDKFVAKRIYEELRGLEVKSNGRVDHPADGHDDQVFSWMMAIYVWYYGKNLAEFGIRKNTIKTDEEAEEPAYDVENHDSLIGKVDFTVKVNEDDQKSPLEQVQEIKRSHGVMYHEWEAQIKAEEDEALRKILSTKQGREAYARKYNMLDGESKNLEFVNKRSGLDMSIFMMDDLGMTEEEKQMALIKKNFNFEFMNFENY